VGWRWGVMGLRFGFRGSGSGVGGLVSGVRLWRLRVGLRI